MRGYPIYVSLSQKPILVVGGGEIASRKVQSMSGTGALISVVSPEVSAALLAQEGVEIYQRPYHSQDVIGKFMVFICTNDPKVNVQIVEDCQFGQLVNDCTIKERSTFYNMATIQTEEFELALSSRGKNPAKTKALRAEIAKLLAEYKK